MYTTGMGSLRNDMQKKQFGHKAILFSMLAWICASSIFSPTPAKASDFACTPMDGFSLQSTSAPCASADPFELGYTGANAVWLTASFSLCLNPFALDPNCRSILQTVQSRATSNPGCCYARNSPSIFSSDYAFTPGVDLSAALADLIDPSTAPPPPTQAPVIVPIPPTGLRAKISNQAIKLNPNVSTIGGIIGTFLNYAFVIAGLILFIMIIWGGFEMLSGAGDPKAQEAAKKRITASALGFILLFASYWIMQILGIVTGASFF